ncbi:MAG: hypothetical protein RBU37_00585 [Myxococcota bacterium]|jgi:hypothetical protein|nr:hypothetical protein [Myxococcota bacterium]
MRGYDVKFTIGGMTGSYIDKYSCTIKNAQYLERYFAELGERAADGPIPLLGAYHDNEAFDPMDYFGRIMKILRRVSVELAERRFYMGVRLEQDGQPSGDWEPYLDAKDSEGELTLHAFGRKAVLVRPGQEPVEFAPGDAEPVLAVEGGRLVCRHETLKALFQEDLKSLITISEEAMAKDAPLFAKAIPHG